MRGPELDQHPFEVLPFLVNSFLNRLRDAESRVDGDMLKAFGFHGLERRGDPLNTQVFSPKLQAFESCSL